MTIEVTMRPILLTPMLLLMACENSIERFGDSSSTDIALATEKDFAIDIIASSPEVSLSYTTSELEDGEWIELSIPMEDMGNGVYAGTLVLHNAPADGMVYIDGHAGAFPLGWKTTDSDGPEYSVDLFPSALNEPVWMGYDDNDDSTVTIIYGWSPDAAEVVYY